MIPAMNKMTVSITYELIKDEISKATKTATYRAGTTMCILSRLPSAFLCVFILFFCSRMAKGIPEGEELLLRYPLLVDYKLLV